MLRFNHFKVGYSSSAPLLDLDFELPKGFHLLIAPNGKGKSTLMRTLAGWIPRLKGEVWIGNKGLETQDVFFIPEHLSFPKYVFPGEWLNSKLSKPLVENDPWIESFGLAPKWRTYLGRMSQGERRKLHWVAASHSDRDLYLLDEAANGLDLKGLWSAQKLVRSLREKDKTVILCTHRFGEWMTMADRLLFIEGGRVQVESREAFVGAKDSAQVIEAVLRKFDQS